jgi:hypothetical protein
LFSKKMASGENLILPIWHLVTKYQVNSQSPLLSGILALNSSLTTIDEWADAVLAVVRPSPRPGRAMFSRDDQLCPTSHGEFELYYDI